MSLEICNNGNKKIEIIQDDVKSDNSHFACCYIYKVKI